MNLIVSKILTGVLSEKVLIAVLLKVGDFLVEKSSNDLDNEVWAEVKKALKKCPQIGITTFQSGGLITRSHLSFQYSSFCFSFV